MNYNQVLLGGRLTRDPELKHLDSGTSVVNFGMAVNRRFGEKEETTFVDVVAWAKVGETIHRFLKKGDPIFISGRLTFEQWEQAGQKRSRLKVTVQDFQFVGKREAPMPAPTIVEVDSDEQLPW
jgi:single-strand DNA-binding protein